MVYADVGVATTGEIIERLRARVDQEKIGDTAKIREYLSEILMDMVGTEGELELPSPSIILVVGVNGVGKTTAIGKMAHYYKSEGKKVMLGAADTFRAAASEQLTIWSERAGVPIVKHGEGADPAAVVFDAISSAKARGCDFLYPRYRRSSAQQKEPDGRTEEDRQSGGP